MCELMGLSFAKPISADFSIRRFALRAAENADGWGLAWYPDRSVAVVKEALDWRTSGYSRFLEAYPRLESTIYLAHVRHRSTSGSPTRADTHPFDRELHGRSYCFAHNGTIRNFGELGLERFHPLGGTDSERLFCHLLALIESRGKPLETAEEWAWMHETLQRLNRTGTLNCLLSDGQRLICYHDLTAWKGLAYRQVRFHDPNDRRLEDQTVAMDLQSDVFNSGYVVATCPLSEHGWQSFQTGQMLVLEGGSIVFSSEMTKTLS